MSTNNSAREKMRVNLGKMENAVNLLLSKGDAMTGTERFELLSYVNVSFHTSGKIEDIFSVDGSVTCEFCSKMRSAAENNILMICGGCYAAKEEWKEAAWMHHKINMRILSSVLFSETELSSVRIPGLYCRINEDGDIRNSVHAQNILRLFKTHPSVSFGFWYKNVSAVESGLNAEGIYTRNDRPKNARFVQSSVLIGFPSVPMWFTDCVFTVYPDSKITLEAIENGAFPCNGRKCKECGFNCYDVSKNSDAVQHIAEVYRCSKEKRVSVLKAYNEKKNEREVI